MPKLARIAALFLAGLLVPGCSDPAEGRVEILGSVVLKSKPIPDGAIVQFDPLENQGTEATAVIAGGKYQIPKVNGLKPGKYRVRVSSGDGKTAVNPVDQNQPPGPGGGANIISKDIVPPEWGQQSKQEITVTAGKPNTFDFTIP